MSIVRANGWQRTNGTVVGAFLQTVQSQKTSQYTTTSDSYIIIPGMSVSITPRAETSKILLMVTVQLSHVDSNTGHIKLYRDSTQIAYGDALGSFEQALFSCRIATGTGGSNDSYTVTPYTICWVDTPQTMSTVTYTVQARARGTTPFYINRSGFQQNNGDNNMGTVPSTITAIEIQA